MVESESYKPTERDMDAAMKHLGSTTIFDMSYGKSATLTQKEAEIRAKLVKEIEYDF
jgi:hypothetical protein